VLINPSLEPGSLASRHGGADSNGGSARATEQNDAQRSCGRGVPSIGRPAAVVLTIVCSIAGLVILRWVQNLFDTAVSAVFTLLNYLPSIRRRQRTPHSTNV